MNLPNKVTHYYRADRLPFQSLTETDPEDVPAVIESLEEDFLKNGHRRSFARPYMEYLYLTEKKLHKLFLESGGIAKRETPLYFVLGSSAWYETVHPEIRKIEIDISRLPAESTSFTYPDSMEAMACAHSVGFPLELKPYHDRLYRLDELSEVVSAYGYPDDDPDTLLGQKYIEIQLWCDDVVEQILKKRVD